MSILSLPIARWGIALTFAIVLTLAVVAGLGYLAGRSGQSAFQHVDTSGSRSARRLANVDEARRAPAVTKSDDDQSRTQGGGTATVQPSSSSGESPNAAPSQRKTPEPHEALAGPEKLFEAVSAAVVQIEVRGRDGKPLAQGSGFFVDDKGTLVTNAHVVMADGAAFVVVRMVDDTAIFVDRIHGIDRDMDLAVLKVKAPSSAFVPLSNTLPKVGARVFALGNPVGLRHTLSDGLVSGLRPIGDKHTVIQTTAPISPGSSGGPLLDDQGNVIGVTTLQLRIGQNLNFAVPASAVAQLLATPEKIQSIASLTEGTSEAGKESQASRPQSRQVVFALPAESLRGFKGVHVIVEELQWNAQAAGLRESDLKSHVELRLRGAGIPVLSEARSLYLEPRSPCLYVSVATISTPDLITYGYVVRVDLLQVVTLLTDSPGNDVETWTIATTWKSPMIYGSVGRLRLKTVVVEALDKMVDNFASAYLSANPKQ